MSETSWQERREFEERLAKGEYTLPSETKRLIDDADACERAEALLEALEGALRTQLGITVMDVTTDDDEGGVRLELVADPSKGEVAMGSFHIPSVDHTVAPATGATTETAIPVPGIGANDVLLAVIVSNPAASVGGLDPAAFTVADGEIESATVDTDGLSLLVLHTVGAVS